MNYLLKSVRYTCFVFWVFFSSILLKTNAQEGSDAAFKQFDENNVKDTENPLLKLIGKPYSEYNETYMYLMHNLLHRDSLSRVKLVRLFDEAANADKSGEWKLLYGMVENTVRFYESRQGGFTWSPDYTAEDYSDKMTAIAENAAEKGFRLIKTFALYQAAEGYRVFVQNYERAFACYLEAAAELETISTKEFSVRPSIYGNIANMYFNFREYDESITFYKKVTEDPNVLNCYPALNGLGLCYRNGYDDYDRSDEYFRQLLDEVKANEVDRKVWEGIAEGNIGYNFYLRGNYDTALIWLVSAIEKITRPEDFAFVSNRAAIAANIYLIKNQPVKAKKYIDIALDRHAKTLIPEKRSLMYEVLFKYNAYLGNRQLAALYHDSTLMAKDRENETYSGLVLRHIEQQLRVSDKKIHEQELQNEKIRNYLLRRTIVIVSVALAIIFSLLWFVFVLYFRKRSAYRELVRRNQYWAGVSFNENSSKNIESDQYDEEIEVPTKYITALEDTNDISDLSVLNVEEQDWLVLKQIEKDILDKKLFKDANLTLDSLSEETGFNKYYLSLVLNRCAQTNFNTYINEFRIKEAIRMFSDADYANITIEGVAFESGFNDRKNFYRVFKKITKLSPSEFRRNITL